MNIERFSGNKKINMREFAGRISAAFVIAGSVAVSQEDSSDFLNSQASNKPIVLDLGIEMYLDDKVEEAKTKKFLGGKTFGPSLPHESKSGSEESMMKLQLGNVAKGSKITGYYCEYNSGYYGDGGNFCGNMANGEIVHEGAAACGYSWELGTQLYIESLNRIVICKDRGHLEPTQVDVFSYYSSNLVSAHRSDVYPLE